MHRKKQKMKSQCFKYLISKKLKKKQQIKLKEREENNKQTSRQKLIQYKNVQ